ncbi:uncharacterized protein J3R85_006594 [Psidium guajava]|nr:uncharacterized protein J3R85_006594 [Psidium guajava]
MQPEELLLSPELLRPIPLSPELLLLLLLPCASLHIVTLPEIATIVSLFASFINLLSFFGESQRGQGLMSRGKLKATRVSGERLTRSGELKALRVMASSKLTALARLVLACGSPSPKPWPAIGQEEGKSHTKKKERKK